MDISEKQWVSLIETNNLLINQLLALDAKVTALTNIQTVMMEGLTKGELRSADTRKMIDEEFQKEYARLKEKFQKRVDGLADELRGG